MNNREDIKKRKDVLQTQEFIVTADNAALADVALPHVRIIVYSELKNAASISASSSQILVSSLVNLPHALWEICLNDQSVRPYYKYFARVTRTVMTYNAVRSWMYARRRTSLNAVEN